MKRSRLGSFAALGAVAIACGTSDGGRDAAGPLARLRESLSTEVKRPSLVSTRILTPQRQSSHALTLDGRVIVGSVALDPVEVTSVWQASVFRPESIRYDGAGVPSFEASHSEGLELERHAGENALSFCFQNPTQPYILENGLAVYRPYVVDSQMFGGDPVFRRRASRIDVSAPFTTTADVSRFELDDPVPLSTQNGGVIYGIEPAMTGDGRLIVFQGHPSNIPTEQDHLMYTYNESPCALAGWSPPRPVSALYSDPNPALKRYPLSWKPLRAAMGEPFHASENSQLIRAAYPWIDPEGRNVLYAAVMFTDNARREAMTLIGVDTNHTAYHVDGAINTSRYDIPHLFYSSPMWMFERERHPSQSLPPGTSHLTRYLPVTKTHDVLPFFGGNTNDYNEVDLGELSDPFFIVHLPMNELVTRGGTYDLLRTPDVGGHFMAGVLLGDARIDPDMRVTDPVSLNGGKTDFQPGGEIVEPVPSPAWQPHGKGKALRLGGNGSAAVTIVPTGPDPTGDVLRGLSVEISVRPAPTINQGCTGGPGPRYVLQHAGVLELAYHPDDSVELSLRIGTSWVQLGKSPPLLRNAWTHVAYTWDGVTGTFAEYLNAAATGRKIPAVPGSLKLVPGVLHVGGGTTLEAIPCPGAQPGAFVGYLDDLRIYSHARSQRSVCLGVAGVDCRAAAIQGNPSVGQFALSQQDPSCKEPVAIGRLGCQKALHRVCAQRGAMDALANSTNLFDTVRQLISDRPPVSMFGVPTWVSNTGATIACAPIAHHSLAVTYEELARFHAGCTDERVGASLACTAAAHRFCSYGGIGWSSGHLFESTSRAWVGCFNADFIAQVPKAQLGPVSNSGNFEATESRLEVSAWCMFRGYEGGLVQEVSSGGIADVHCFRSPAVVAWPFLP